MKMQRVMVQLPQPLKAQLDAMRREGYTASGYLRALLELDLQGRKDVRRKLRRPNLGSDMGRAQREAVSQKGR